MILSDANAPLVDPGSPWSKLAARVLNDSRDLPFLKLVIAIGAVVLPLAAGLFLVRPFRWSLACVYWAILFGVFADKFILMLHNTSHRPLFRRRYRFLSPLIPWVLGPFFGESPETYFAHHVGMHHPENNLRDDLSTTMPYQRDSLADFLRYFLKFFTVGIYDLCRYFRARKRAGLLRRTLVGEAAFYLLLALGAAFNWRASVAVFAVPFVAVRFLMMCGNWGQHAFIDASDPGNFYRSSITCINSRYNRRCFNDGYHIGHHLHPTLHWSEMPGELQRNLDTYRAERALVFEGLDFFLIWALLMTRQHGALARRLSPLGGEQPSEAERVALLKSRLLPCEELSVAEAA